MGKGLVVAWGVVCQRSIKTCLCTLNVREPLPFRHLGLGGSPTIAADPRLCGFLPSALGLLLSVFSFSYFLLPPTSPSISLP